MMRESANHQLPALSFAHYATPSKKKKLHILFGYQIDLPPKMQS